MKPYTDRPLSLQQRSVFGLSALCGAGVGILLAVGWHLAVRAVLPSGVATLLVDRLLGAAAAVAGALAAEALAYRLLHQVVLGPEPGAPALPSIVRVFPRRRVLAGGGTAPGALSLPYAQQDVLRN